MDHTPLVIAHRGGADALPEHTLGAYRRALDEGADGVECDVRLTRDGHLVCVHDSRLDRTSNGRGRVSAKTLAELDGLDFGSWHPGCPADEELPDLFRLLTLEHLLDTLLHSGRRVRLLIETKHPTRHGAEVERRLVAMLRRFGLDEPKPGDPVQVTVMSFSAIALRRLRAWAPRLPRVYLMEFVPPGVGRGHLPFGARTAGPGVELIRAKPGLLPAFQAAGHAAYVWTVNEPEDLELVMRHRVDAVITDRPRFVLEQLERV
ncbi:glycerophosphodiester phosphodiesterase [Actinoplanes rectilineatus]|uniref:glycerophosphodiester phosphodiesterase n=1 Tax=Actinoplanes rectilineatus TaxID=113571 RepID=UPI0005F2A56A|nr:glycerophosphodiester phosphodiesterase family protein [Actinoplanes rectilineatus]